MRPTTARQRSWDLRPSDMSRNMPIMVQTNPAARNGHTLTRGLWAVSTKDSAPMSTPPTIKT
jgi:hypothetical protein